MQHKPNQLAPSAAQAFEQLCGEVSLLESAVKGLTSAREKIPDYSPMLRSINRVLDDIMERLTEIDAKPAMLLTPETVAVQMARAALTVRAEDRAAIGDAREALARSLGRSEGMIKKGRSSEEQEWWVTWAATGGMLIGAFLALIGVAMWS